jgi:hypothetical protein
MFKFLRKIFFMEDNKENTNTVSTTNDNFLENIQNNVKKRFEVEIYDKITYGEPPMEQIKLERVHYDNPVIIEAASKKDLDEFGEKLSLCKQTFKIVRVLDDVLPNKNNIEQQKNQQIASNKQEQDNLKTDNVEKQKPKFYKIGNIEIKDDNGKIYQKQWLRLTDDEMSNFRIINNKNNAIVKLNDKSIEMKKWVLVETSDEYSNTMENCL